MLGGFVQGTLEAIDGHDPALGRRVREALAPETRAAIEGASRIGFVPVALDVEVTERLYAVAGPDTARAILRANLAATFTSPLLRSFMDMALRLRGRDPARLFEWGSKVWNQLYRGCGAMAFQGLGPGEGRCVLEGLPPEIAEHPEYLDGAAAAISALFDLVEIEGRAELKAVDPDGQRAIISVLWETDAETA